MSCPCDFGVCSPGNCTDVDCAQYEHPEQELSFFLEFYKSLGSIEEL